MTSTTSRFTTAQLTARREARATVDSLLGDLRRPCVGLAGYGRSEMQTERETRLALAAAYDVVAETSSAPDYERGQAATHRSLAAALAAQIDGLPAYSHRLGCAA